MVLQSAQAVETKIADWAKDHKRCVAVDVRMASLHVHLELARLCKAVATRGTDVRSFSGVNADVLRQIAGVVERLLAELALVRRVSRVDARVPRQPTCVRKLPVAVLA